MKADMASVRTPSNMDSLRILVNDKSYFTTRSNSLLLKFPRGPRSHKRSHFMKFWVLLSAMASVTSTVASASVSGYSMDEGSSVHGLYRLKLAHEVCGVSTAYLGSFESKLNAFMSSHGQDGVSLKTRYAREKPLLVLDLKMSRGFEGACPDLRSGSHRQDLIKLVGQMLAGLQTAHAKAHH